MTNVEQRYVLFYSPKNGKSLEIVNTIQKAGCRGVVVFVNVDNIADMALPSAISTVPCMWDRMNNAVVSCDEVINGYMEYMRNQQKGCVGETKTGKIEPSAVLLNTSLTDAFSFLEEGGGESDDVREMRSFVYIDDMEERIYTPGDKSSSRTDMEDGGGSKISLEKLQQERDNDVYASVRT